MAWSASDLAVVEAAILARINGGGVESYSVQGRNVKYMSLEELRALRAEMKREINSTAARRITKASFRYS